VSDRHWWDSIARVTGALLVVAVGPGVVERTLPFLAYREPITILNVAHRGASGLAPEHTFAAYDLALTSGADYIEQDLQMTKDGVLVVLHDATLDRTARGDSANCTGAVREKTLAQIATCDVGTWFNERRPDRARAEYRGQRIPTLDQVLVRYHGRTRFYIETKQPEDAPGMEKELLRVLDQHDLARPSGDRHVLVQSFSPASLQMLHRLAPDVPLIQLLSSPNEAKLDEIRAYAVGIGPSVRGLTAELVHEARARCLDVHPYTIVEPAEMNRLIDLGVTGMFTDYPDRLRDVLATRGRQPMPCGTPCDSAQQKAGADRVQRVDQKLVTAGDVRRTGDLGNDRAHACDRGGLGRPDTKGAPDDALDLDPAA
jgi:glycerophosphoryl diester phosphodiesterase